MTPVAVEQSQPSIQIAPPAPSPASLHPCREADWIVAKPFLSARDRDALWRLFSFMWQRGRPLPNRPAELAAIAKVPLHRWDAVAGRLGQFVERDEFIRRTSVELLARRVRVVTRRQTTRTAARAEATA